MGNEMSREMPDGEIINEKNVGFELPTDCVEITHKDLLTASQELLRYKIF